MKTIFAVSFYCAAVIERNPEGWNEETYYEAAQDDKGNYTDNDAAVGRFAAEVEAGEEAVRTFFTVYRVDGEGLSHAVSDHTDRDEARQIAALLNAGLLVPGARSTLLEIAENEATCDCDITGWHGEGHATLCPISIAKGEITRIDKVLECSKR